MTTRATGDNILSTLRVTRTLMNLAANRWEIYYRITKENAEPRTLINTTPERPVFIRNTPEQIDEEGNVIAEADNALSLFQDLITSYDSIISASEAKAIEHAEETGVFTEYVDPTEGAWETELPTPPPIAETTPWEAGVFVAVGMIRSYNGQVYQVIQGHVTQQDWTPDVVPALFRLITQTSGTELPAWVQPQGSVGIYGLGDQVSHNGTCWESAIPNNGFEPGATGIGDTIWFNIPCP